VLMTLDGNHLRIPNATVFKAVILNYSRNPERRFKFELGVDAEDDPLAAMETGLAAIRKLDFVLAVPKPDAVINAVGDSNILITFTGWVNQQHSEFQKARSLAIRAAKIALEENGFTIPEPIYRLRFDQKPSGLFDTSRSSEATATVNTGAQKNKDPQKDKPSTPLTDKAALTDVAPDMHIEKIVNNERIKSSETDLLDTSRPIE
jgi:small conductance mechanosensitive channel